MPTRVRDGEIALRALSFFRAGAALLAFAAAIGGCRIFEPAAPQPTPSAPAATAISAGELIVSADFSDDSQHLAILCEDGQVIISNVITEKIDGRLRLPPGSEGGIDLVDGRRFAVVFPEIVLIWSAGAGREASFPRAGTAPPLVIFDEATGDVAIPDVGGAVTVRNLDPTAPARAIAPEGLEGDVTVQRGPGSALVYLEGDGALRIVPTGAGAEEVRVAFPRRAGAPVSVSRDARAVASIGPDGAVEVRTLPDGALLTTLEEVAETPRCLAISPDASAVAIDGSDGGIVIHAVSDGRPLARHAATLWRDGNILFSPAGFTLAWIDDGRKEARTWSPVHDLVRQTPSGPALIEPARTICKDVASAIRLRNARDPFNEGRRLLDEDRPGDALAALSRAREIFPEYPGLAEALATAEERHNARIQGAALAEQIAALDDTGNYYAVLGAIDGFLAKFPGYDDGAFRAAGESLRKALGHFEVAESHRKAGRAVDAVLEFDAARAIQPSMARWNQVYEELRKTTIDGLTVTGARAAEQGDDALVLATYHNLVSLRPLDDAELLRKGVAHANLGQNADAITALETIPRDADEFGPARWRLGAILRDTGNLPRARVELELAAQALSDNVDVERDLAAICERLQDIDAAVEAWRRVGNLLRTDPEPFEIAARLDEGRARWGEAASSYETAIARSSAPRPDLELELVQVYGKAGRSDLVLRTYRSLLDQARRGVKIEALGAEPERAIVARIRELGFVHHRGDWMPREQFLTEQGWVRHKDVWVRPEELRLRELAARLDDKKDGDLRNLADERYRSEASERRMLQGMNRHEVVTAWGFFEDQNSYRPESRPGLVLDQLIFPDGRQVFLRNGLVCFWTE